MTPITIEDCEALKEKFDNYTETAEQHQFGMLFIADTMMQKSIKAWKEAGEVNQLAARSMFRTIGMIIGFDITPYKEPKENE